MVWGTASTAQAVAWMLSRNAGDVINQVNLGMQDLVRMMAEFSVVAREKEQTRH